MSGLNRMLARVNYTGYDRADGRNVSGKYKSFQSALKNAYQAEWITLNKDTENEQKWRCLINPSRLTEQFDKKVISIDFDSGVEEGTVFYWDRTKRYWIINLQQHTEEAYFRGTITRCDQIMDVNGRPYWVTVRGPVETTTRWTQKHGIAWNDLNYSMLVEITKDSNTVNYFSRHQVVKMKLAYPDVDTGETIEEWHNWKVVATDKYSEEKIIQVYLNEWFDNDAEDDMVIEPEGISNPKEPHILAPADVYVFDTNVSFSIVGLSGGEFVINSDKVKIISIDDKSCVVDILASKSTEFTISYKTQDKQIDKIIKVKSF